MSRRPALSCWRRGRSVRGTVEGRVAAAVVAVGAVVGSEGVAVEGFTEASVDVVEGAAVVVAGAGFAPA